MIRPDHNGHGPWGCQQLKTKVRLIPMFLSGIETSRWHGSCDDISEAVVRVMKRQSFGALIKVGGGEVRWSITRVHSVHQRCSLVETWGRTVWMPSLWFVRHRHRQTRPTLSLSVGLNIGSNGACLDSVYLIQLNIYPPRYLLCSALKPVKACACSCQEGGMTGAEVRVHWKGKHSQPAHVKARRCILPKNEETDWNFTSTLDMAPKCLPTSKSTDTLTVN